MFEINDTIKEFDAENENVESSYSKNVDYEPDDDELDLSEENLVTLVSSGNLEFATVTNEEKEILHRLHVVNHFDENFPPPKDESAVIREKNVSLEYRMSDEEVAEQKKNGEKNKTLMVDCMEWLIDTVNEGVDILQKTSGSKEHIRTYNKEVEMPKVSYKKPTEQKNDFSQLFVFAFICLVMSCAIGFMANSYFNFKGGSVESVVACSYLWLFEANMSFSLFPFNSSAFFTAFMIGFGILAVVFFVVWIDSNAKKQSRVGHEHGNAHLGKARDFRSYRQRFME